MAYCLFIEFKVKPATVSKLPRRGARNVRTVRPALSVDGRYRSRTLEAVQRYFIVNNRE